MLGLKFYLTHPRVLFSRIMIYIDQHYFDLPDKLYLSCFHRYHHQKKMNWNHPKGYCEKLNWLKINDRNPLYTQLVDKIEVKKYVANVIGEEYVIPTIAVYNSASEINWDELPQKFAIKCNHDSGSCIVCQDKEKLNKKDVDSWLHYKLNKNWFKQAREWAYKDVNRRILVEELMKDPSGDIKDYKFFCFDGEVKALYIVNNRQNQDINTTSDFFDADFNWIPVKCHFDNSSVLPERPLNFELMKNLCSKLSKGFPQVRIDFYEASGKVYFGEFTFYTFGAENPLCPEQYELLFGSWINLNKLSRLG